ncbi:hypothetical protein BJI69_04805 [Luteibacter rhizovicinus DSM 16549]|uniref:Uncharacterized protein n=1 Tax=Luteibacter rhizovicinus DSM 16549 TaxID=1440763 RepID=A0A0G9HDL6_9GAMM|nr:hypothetical protein BJI69_04805 [Luteibacter rhizovicinus DSM 16549]KLD67728.1 hypothetical protein Y883_06075 [Luteibacter rhizovicinus DSM 16549]KLD78237.1 hypothetical protein Y886_11380 [Xanthomonas hyacinthi DSM 19077]
MIEIGLWIAVALAVLFLISGYGLSLYLEWKRSKSLAKKILHNDFDEAISPRSVAFTSGALVTLIAIAAAVSIPSLDDVNEGALLGAVVGAIGGAVGPFSYAFDRPKSELWRSLTFWVITLASAAIAALSVYAARNAFTQNSLRLAGSCFIPVLLFFLLRRQPWNEPTWQWPGRLIWSGFSLMGLIALVGISAAFGAF